MLIGIDASRATSAQPTGTEIYSRELIRALLALDQRNHYRLYTRERVAHDFFVPHELRIVSGEGRVARGGLREASGELREASGEGREASGEGRVANSEPRTPNSEFRTPNPELTHYAIRTIPFPRLWTHARLSWEMLTRAPDVLWVPAHVLPLIHPRRSFVTIHDLGQVHFPHAHPPLQRAYHNFAVWWAVRAASHIFADSESTRDDLSRFFRVSPEKISVVYPAYDAQLYRPIRDAAMIEQIKAKYRISRDYVLTMGTLHPRKNYVRLIEAFAKLSIDNCQLVIVGKRGWLYHTILERVRACCHESRIILLDYISASDLPILISGARVFAFPSLYEGFGLPILEAQACGTPVVCSMTSSLPEAAGDAALFFDPLDVDAMAGAIQRAWTDEALRAKLIARGFENVKRFSWEVSARQVLRAFETEDG